MGEGENLVSVVDRKDFEDGGAAEGGRDVDFGCGESNLVDGVCDSGDGCGDSVCAGGKETGVKCVKFELVDGVCAVGCDEELLCEGVNKDFEDSEDERGGRNLDFVCDEDVI